METYIISNSTNTIVGTITVNPIDKDWIKEMRLIAPDGATFRFLPFDEAGDYNDQLVELDINYFTISSKIVEKTCGCIRREFDDEKLARHHCRITVTERSCGCQDYFLERE